MLNKFLLALILSAAAITVLNAQATKEIPAIVDRYHWDKSSGEWVRGQRKITEYDSLGRRDMVYWLSLPAQDTLSKIAYLHDTMGQESGQEIFIFKNGSWVQGRSARFIRSYNTGKLAEDITQYYDTSAAAWENSGRLSYTYDPQGRRLSSINQTWKNGAWQNESRLLYDYTKNQRERQTWDGTQWYGVERCIDILWRGLGPGMREYINQTYDSDSQNWVNAKRYKYMDGVNGGFDDLLETWDGITGWTPESKSHIKNNAHGHTIFGEHRVYTGGSWHLITRQQIIHTYDGSRLLQSISQSWIPDDKTQPDEGGKWENYLWIKYAGFIQIPTGIPTAHEQPVVNVFPNPATRLLNITTDTKYNTAEIIDLSGKTVMTAELKGNKTIDVSGLPSGYYLLRLTGRGLPPAVSKVVKK